MPDFDGLYRALIAKTASSVCPYCGVTDWDTGADHAVHLRAVGDDDALTSSKYFDALPLFCSNCGYIRLHLLGPLENAGTDEGR